MRFTFLLYDFSYSKAFINNNERVSSEKPKATCVLFSIACKINLGLVKNNGNPGGTGGSVWPWKSGWEGGSKNLAIRRGGGVDFFWNNPMSHIQINKCFVIGVV